MKDTSDLKSVRIDSKTVILVSRSISDTEAKNKYLEKKATLSMRSESPQWKQRYQRLKEKNNPVPEVPEDIQELDTVPEDIEAGDLEEIKEEDIETEEDTTD